MKFDNLSQIVGAIKKINFFRVPKVVSRCLPNVENVSTTKLCLLAIVSTLFAGGSFSAYFWALTRPTPSVTEKVFVERPNGDTRECIRDTAPRGPAYGIVLDDGSIIFDDTPSPFAESIYVNDTSNLKITLSSDGYAPSTYATNIILREVGELVKNSPPNYVCSP